LRTQPDGNAYVTDNGNAILDCRIQLIEDPAALDRAIQSIPGAVGTGLFVDMADAVIVGRDGGPEVLERSAG
jgi:ribose 5-phosphate isomerase A